MNSFLGYIVLGLTLAAPIGPVNSAQLDKGIRFGFFHAWLVGLGAMVADAVFMLLIYFGLAHFLSTPFMKTFLWSFGCFVLLYCGIDSMRNAHALQADMRQGNESSLRSFSSGFFMTLTNPLSILFWLGIYGSILAKTAETYATWDLLLYSSGIFIGIFLWDVGMAAAASLFARWLNSHVLGWITRIAGFSLIVFGVYFGWQAVHMLASRL
ncbi:amino acid transporter [Xylanibacillus composti]|uniref:Amino acid transporter n=1 Tax=Xylanibacillus composti TaxID=1572762 RepID=A0A8J4M3Q4_9BACL|nr:LysE family translocator [Xylanibacillus composti]MDT9724493.1 amino acid transporter [Xylanibacillus composti]GIQ69756.1 amino acid transporter [Xylanibacillus composti]